MAFDSDATAAPANFVVVVHSALWRSQVERFLDQLKPMPSVHWDMDIESASRTVVGLGNHGSVTLLAELPDSFCSDPDPILDCVARFQNNPQRCPIFLFGHPEDESFRTALAVAGASDCCFSMLDIAPMWTRLNRHLNSHRTVELSVENQIFSRLPW
jgi:hypothetical protein